jgi:hypothetical protein
MFTTPMCCIYHVSCILYKCTHLLNHLNFLSIMMALFHEKIWSIYVPFCQCLFCLVYGVQRHFQQYFSYFVVVSFIGGGNRSTRRELTAACHWQSLSHNVSSTPHHEWDSNSQCWWWLQLLTSWRYFSFLRTWIFCKCNKDVNLMLYIFSYYLAYLFQSRVRHGCGFTTMYAIGAYHHLHSLKSYFK